MKRLIPVLAALLVLACETPPEPINEVTTEPQIVESEPTGPDAGWVHRRPDITVEVALAEPFIKIVDLRKLRIGMTEEEVLAIFPDPEQIRLRGDDELWRYGFAELVFRDERLRDWFNY